jgi:ubiquinone/menaquinone biosynthesis C-methylase UbiE
MTDDPRKTFSKSARRYLDSTDHRTGADLVVISETARALFPGVTLDIATGAGHALRAAAPYSGYALAVDLTAEMLKVAREHLSGAGLNQMGYMQARADRLPLPDESVNLVTCRIACHHFSSIPDFLSEVRRVLAPQGSFVMVDSVVSSDEMAGEFLNKVEKLRDPSHIRSFEVRQWLEFFRKGRLPIASVSTFERIHPFPEWSQRVVLDEKDLQELEKSFQDAPDNLKELFRIEQDSNGSIISYTDEKVIIVAEKR